VDVTSNIVSGYDLIENIFTSMYSLSVQGKHLMNLIILSRLGPKEFITRTFTVRRYTVELMGIISWKT
jgi:hypothetical protein